ncbi:MAG: hydrogenase maturation nickel metallochaperone HypA [Bacteroidia bacterium]|nr:hydrogenase maturation nickel metallochaperone HypA [Bacteroidia bacterium]
MHELSIAQSILAIAENSAPKNSNAVVTGVNLQIGELSGIEIETLEFALSIIKENTVLQKADVNIEIIKGEAQCSDCNTIFPISSFGTCCPQCGGYSMKILKGREMRVLNLIVNEE